MKIEFSESVIKQKFENLFLIVFVKLSRMNEGILNKGCGLESFDLVKCISSR